MTRASTFVIGIAMGTIGILLYQRLRQVIRDEDPEVLADRLGQQLQTLEDRLGKPLPSIG